MYVSHMRPLRDVDLRRRRPAAPRLLASLEVPIGWHSHKVRTKDGLMIVNYEKFRTGADDFGGGLGIYDVSRPDRPLLIKHWKTGTQGGGVHRYDFDGRYAYISPTAPGFIGNIVKILDLQEPSRPQEVGSWWIPGQNAQAGEDYPGTTMFRHAATIRCAWATGCTSPIGTTACSSWTSRTCPDPGWYRNSTPARRIPIRPTPPCRSPCR